MEQKILTIKEAAGIMRVSPSMMYQLVREDKAPHISIGKRKVIPAERFFKWLDNSTKGGC